MEAEGIKKKSFVKRHKKLLIIGAIIIVVLALLFVYVSNAMKNALDLLSAPPATMVLAKTDLEKNVAATGVFQSTNTRYVNSSIAAEITAVYVKTGDKVSAGDTLCQLDTSAIDQNIKDIKKQISDAAASDALSVSQAQRRFDEANTQYYAEEAAKNNDVNNALAALNAANSALAAAQSVLAADTPGSPTYQAALDDVTAKTTAQTSARAAYDAAVALKNSTMQASNSAWYSARDALDSAKQHDSASSFRSQLQKYEDERADCTIKAPISGTVTAVTAEAGSFAGSGVASGASSSSGGLFTIEDTGSLEIIVSVAEYDAVSITPGLKAEIKADALEGQTWTGIVESISPKATDAKGNFTVTVSVTSPVGALSIGMTAKVTIAIESKANVFAVPYDAVVTKDDGTTVVYAYDPTAAGGPGAAGNTGSGEAPVQESGPLSISVGSPQSGGTQTDGLQVGMIDMTNRIEIPVTTGMETDYYIEIIGDGLEEGMVILTDPEGKNASNNMLAPMMMIG